MTLQALGIDKLSADERRELMHDIWDSLSDAEAARGPTAAEAGLIDARLAARDANPAGGAPWDEVNARLVGR